MQQSEESPPGRVRDPLLVGALAALHGLALHWQAFADPLRFHENWRQSPHWLNEAHRNFQEGDAMVAYATFNTSPFADFLYTTLAMTGQDLLWGKVNAVLWYALTAALICITGRSMSGRLAGFAAAALFMFFPSSFKVFGGGFMSGLSMPLLCLAVLVTHKQAWRWSIPLIAFQSLAYPMVAIQSGVLYIVDTVANDLPRLRDRSFLLHKLLPLVIAAAVCGAFILNKYPSGGHAYGHIVDRVEIGDRPDFSSGGRTNVVPVKSVLHQAEKRWADPFHVTLLVLAFLVLGRGIVRLPRGLWSLLITGVVLYWIADLLLLRLYFPDRYILRSFPLFMALTGGTWVARMREQLAGVTVKTLDGALPVWPVLAAALAVVGVGTFHESILPPGDSRTKVYDEVELYEALKALPGTPMVAAHPRVASELQLMSGRSMFVTRELSHPWWTGWWELVTERTEVYFKAAHDRYGAHLRFAIAEHHIDYWVVDRRQYTAKGRMRRGKRRHYVAPFDDWIATDLRPSRQDLLRSVPRSKRLYDDEDRFFIVSSEALLQWLEATGK